MRISKDEGDKILEERAINDVMKLFKKSRKRDYTQCDICGDYIIDEDMYTCKDKNLRLCIVKNVCTKCYHEKLKNFYHANSTIV